MCGRAVWETDQSGPPTAYREPPRILVVTGSKKVKLLVTDEPNLPEPQHIIR